MAGTLGSIVLNPDSLTAALGPDTVTWRWDDVSRVVAFKRDALTSDLLCLAIERGDQLIELNEDMGGWNELLDRLSSYLPGALSGQEILGAIVQPPFSANPTTVYDRDA